MGWGGRWGVRLTDWMGYIRHHTTQYIAVRSLTKSLKGAYLCGGVAVGGGGEGKQTD